ncbi:MAG: 7-carboxy-7-deazaguanine synthase QueE [Pseudomonadota bacterium]
MSRDIRISEIFGPTIQGEGALIGQPTVFVRTGGCDYRCSWCDTLHAVDSEFRHSWKPMSAEDIMNEIETLSGGEPLMVSLSGGNPAIQPLRPLIDLGHEKNYRFALETQGSIAQDWFEALDVLTLSPKPPSSEMDTDWDAFDECLKAAGDGPEIALKIVVFDDADYAYAREAAARYPDLPLYLQPGNHQVEGDADQEALNARMRWIVEKVQDDKWFKAHILPQLHVMLWGNKQGV